MTLNIYNSIGKLVKTENNLHNQQIINIEDLSNGIYIVEVKSNKETRNQKLLIQK
jgi:hypothetical protein